MGMNETPTPLNLRGVQCPMNMVKTKVALSKAKLGEVLQVILDNGAPIRNVPRTVTQEGHEILRQEQLEDGCWLVEIRKAK